MFNRVSLPLCLLAAAVVASGCGSTETATKASASAPSQASPQTGPTAAQPTTKAQKPPPSKRTVEAVKRQLEGVLKRKISPAVAERVTHKVGKVPAIHKIPAATKQKIEALKRKIDTTEGSVPVKKRYTGQEQIKFMQNCEAAKTSHPDCECVLVKQELSKVETGQSLVEVLALEFALSEGVSMRQAIRSVPFPAGGSRRLRLPRGIRRNLEACLT
jgi:hypothetical protein